MSATQPRPISGTHESVPEAQTAHHTLLSLEVSGGFLDGVKFEFADGLNCVIGGRGTGKTTVLEFVRYALALMPDPRVNLPRARALAALVQNNLDGGSVEVQVETKHGASYRAVRPADEIAQVFDEQGAATALSLDRDHLFKADVYSQNEIEEIATNPVFQLALIDKFIAEEVQRIDQEIGEVQHELGENAATLLRLQSEARGLRERAGEATGLAETLKTLQETSGPDASLLNSGHARRALREKERKTLELLSSDLKRTAREFQSLVSESVLRLESRIDREDVARGPNAAVFTVVDDELARAVALLNKAAQRVQEQAEKSERIVGQEAKKLAGVHAQQEAAYRELVARSNEASGRAVERTKLQRRHAEAMEATKEMEVRSKQREGFALRRRDLVAQLSSLRDKRFEHRKKIAEWLSAALTPSIRVSVSHMARREGYAEHLNEAFKGSGVKYSLLVDKLIQLPPAELAELVQRGEPGRLAARSSLDLDRAQKVIDVLRGTTAIYELEILELEDLPRVELRDGEEYKDSARLSTGQRCTTILPILLLESERPLLVDQPEDNLDNAFIYDTVVKSIKGAKGRRQLIFVTHNPNIPVLGDAERVFVLTSDGKRGGVKRVGTVDEVKEEIELHLEGGRDAFALRHKRYGH